MKKQGIKFKTARC